MILFLLVMFLTVNISASLGVSVAEWAIIKMTMAVTLYGQYCRRHLVGQQVVRDISAVRSC